MTAADDLLHAASLFDTPHTQVKGMQRDQIARSCGLDLATCNVCTIVHALNEFDHKALADGRLSHAFETWPDGVKASCRKEMATFSGRNNGARIEAVTMAIGGEPKAFILCLHWRPRA
ncbi:MAG: hypothetical protein WC670_18320 [Pseudolabrys sp.]|jgi:hypothetical protein